MRVLTKAEFDALDRDENGQLINITESFEYEGHAFLCQVPLEIPVGMQIPETVESMVARLVRQENMVAAARGEESSLQEEMDDFEVDQEDLLTGYQVHDMVPELPKEAKGIEPLVKGGDGDGRAKSKAGGRRKSDRAPEKAGGESDEGGSGVEEQNSAGSAGSVEVS